MLGAVSGTLLRAVLYDSVLVPGMIVPRLGAMHAAC